VGLLPRLARGIVCFSPGAEAENVPVLIRSQRHGKPRPAVLLLTRHCRMVPKTQSQTGVDTPKR
jgi:hypothetical protein